MFISVDHPRIWTAFVNRGTILPATSLSSLRTDPGQALGLRRATASGRLGCGQGR